MILDRTAALHRLTPDANDANYEYLQQIVSSFRINIQPESSDFAASIGETYGRTSRAYTLQSGIRINDKVAVSGLLTASGREYRVTGVADWNMPPLAHYELHLVEAGI